MLQSTKRNSAQSEEERKASEVLKALSGMKIEQDVLSSKLNDALIQKEYQSTYNAISKHIYHNGFMTGMYYDIIVRAFSQSFKLHRIILTRSPFFEKLLSGRNESEIVVHLTQRDGMLAELGFMDPNLTAESLIICLSYLYGAPVYSHITQANVYQVMSLASLFELHSLADLCLEFATEQLSAKTVLNSVGWLVSGFKYGKYTEKIHEATFKLLSETLPKDLNVFVDRKKADQLVDLFVKLPFSWLREIFEVRLQAPKEFDKFQLAKRVIDVRKKATKNVKLPFSTSNSPKLLGENENVVLLFDREGGRVSLTEQVHKKQLLKHLY